MTSLNADESKNLLTSILDRPQSVENSVDAKLKNDGNVPWCSRKDPRKGVFLARPEVGETDLK